MLTKPATPPLTQQEVSELSALLRECVEAGASIGFVLPLPGSEIASYWSKISAELISGDRLLVIAQEPGSCRIVGAAQLVCETRPNGRHRAEVQKVMVLPAYRRRGIAARLMADLEAAARSRARTLLVLDTSEGAGGAGEFYRALGYDYAGGIPGYALDPDGKPSANAIFYKTLGPAS